MAAVVIEGWRFDDKGAPAATYWETLTDGAETNVHVGEEVARVSWMKGHRFSFEGDAGADGVIVPLSVLIELTVRAETWHW